MKIYLIRHGQTTGDVEDRFGGDYDDHLTDEGKSQSKNLANKLKDKSIEMIFASPKIRAQETAQILSEILNTPVETVENIRERNAYGILTGMIKEEARQKYPEMTEEVKNYKNTIEGAENYNHFRERILKAFEEISSKNYQTVAVVTHGGPIHCFFREVLKKEISKLHDCGMAEIDKNGDYEVVGTDGLDL